jgi:hypothetical protein
MHHLVFYRLVYGSPGYGFHWVDIAVRWHCSPAGKSEYFFQQHWESEYFFRKKT